MAVLNRSVVQLRHSRCCAPARTSARRVHTHALPRRPYSAASASSDIAEQLLDKEAQLRALFESGQPMPKSSVVSALRREIAQLREQLQRQLTGSADDVAGTASNQAVASTLSQVAAERARRALLEVETNLSRSLASDSFDFDLTPEEHAELQLLELENAQLRSRANALLTRQQFLENLLRQHNISPSVSTAHANTLQLNEIEESKLEALPVSYSKDATAVMRAPSYY